MEACVFVRIFPTISAGRDVCPDSLISRAASSLFLIECRYPPTLCGWIPQSPARDQRALRGISRPAESSCRFHDSSASKPRVCLSRLASHQTWNFRGKRNRLKKINNNNVLRAQRDHICVLFVQHPSENTLHRPVSERSVVVCARTFGNCDRATEGGIPRSSRLGLSLKSLAFMRVCPKTRRWPRR